MIRKAAFQAVSIAVALFLGVAMPQSSVFAQKLAVATAGPQTLTLNDKVGHNQFSWISDAPLESIKGTSEGVTGTLTIDPADLSKLHGTVKTQTSTMKTGNTTRDNHLHSAEWLDVNRYPTISFAITGTKDVKTNGAGASGYAVGNFTMHGVTKPMMIPFQLTYVPESDKTRQRATGDLVMINATFNVSLKDYNVTGTEGQLGSKVGESIKITAQLFGNTTKDGTASAE